MSKRFLLVGTLVGAIVLFVWQTISHVVLPWHDASYREFTNADAVVATVRANAGENALYWSPRGLLAVVAIDPDVPDRAALMPAMMGRQLLINMATAFLMCILIGRLRRVGPIPVAATFGFAGLAAGIATRVSDWNWYGFPTTFASVNAVDLAIGWTFAGLVLGLVAQRIAPGIAFHSSEHRVPASKPAAHVH